MNVRGAIAAGLVVLGACAAADAQQAKAHNPAELKMDAKTADYVGRMLAYSMEVRTGRYEAAAKAVAMMEAATQAEPANAELWAQLGNAYGLQATALGQAGKPMEAFALLDKGLVAQSKALDLDPNNIVALGGHGSNAAIFSLFRNQPELGVRGLREMDRAVEMAPTSHVQRLLRGMTLINLPEAMRNRAKEKSDLAFAADYAKGTKQGDVVRILYADVLFEGGERDSARGQYVLAAKSATAGGDIARERLASLDAGGVSQAAITQLRRDTANCAVCHGG